MKDILETKTVFTRKESHGMVLIGTKTGMKNGLWGFDNSRDIKEN